MIIFGWGRQTIKVFGPTILRMCDHCHNEHYWVLTRVMTWFTLFFIPIFPYSIKYLLSCPVCQFGFSLNEAEDISKIRLLAETNKLLLDGKISEIEYGDRLGINEPQGSNGHTEERVAVELSKREEKFKFCSGCGKEVTAEIKFCSHCGTHVAHTD